MELHNIILLWILSGMIFMQLSQKYFSPMLLIFNRWLRWGLFSFGVGFFLYDAVFKERPYWTLVVLCALCWFLLESIYNWLFIKALSRSDLPLFPDYQLNPNGDEWPAGRVMDKLKDWLRREGYKPIQSLRAEMIEGVYVRMSVYEHSERKMRLQIIFFPQGQHGVAIYHVLLSEMKTGERVMTDNLQIPFGGFYPQEWHVTRCPWVRSLRSLELRHRQRVETLRSESVLMEKSPLEDVLYSQRQLETLNTQLGFFNPHQEREEFGKITSEGCFRVWQEIWLMDYFGRSWRHSS
jgi:hypothetical protein